MAEWLIGGMFIILLLVLAYSARRLEKKNFNNGICQHCFEPLEKFDCDSMGGRGYICRNCGFVTWVSYSIDNKYARSSVE